MVLIGELHRLDVPRDHDNRKAQALGVKRELPVRLAGDLPI